MAHNANEIGVLTALSQPSPDALRQAIRETRKLTSKPFGVNITLLPSINPPDYEGFARAAVEEGVRIFETAGNNRESNTAFALAELANEGVCCSWTSYQILQRERMCCHPQVYHYSACEGTD